MTDDIKADRRSHDLIVQSPVALMDSGRFEHMWRVAQMMARATIGVPAHLQGKPEDCMLVVSQADRWNMDPVTVAQKTFVIQGRLGYEAQLIAAVINSSRLIQERLRHEYSGDGDALVCTVYGRFKGESFVREKESPRIGRIKIKNSPLWDVDPKQQLLYWTQRAWARAHASDMILGVYTNDELEDVEYSVQEVPPPPRRADYEPKTDAIDVPEPEPEEPYQLYTQENQVTFRSMVPEEYAEALLRVARETPSRKDLLWTWNLPELHRLAEVQEVYNGLVREYRHIEVPKPAPPPPPPSPPQPPPPAAKGGKEWVVIKDGSPIFRTAIQDAYIARLVEEAKGCKTEDELTDLWQANYRTFVNLHAVFQDEIGDKWDRERLRVQSKS